MAIKHKMTHQKNLSCPSCSRVFHIKRELDWHEAECVGRQNATETCGIRTRRIHRCPDEDLGPDEARTSLRLLTKTPTLSERLQSVQKWCNSAASVATGGGSDDEIPQDDDTRSIISRFTSVSQKTALTCISSRSGWSNISIRTDYSYKSAKTVRTLKEERDYLQSCRVTRSIASRVKKIDLEIKVRELPHRSYGTTRSRATSRRHFDITRRGKKYTAKKNVDLLLILNILQLNQREKIVGNAFRMHLPVTVASLRRISRISWNTKLMCTRSCHSSRAGSAMRGSHKG